MKPLQVYLVVLTAAFVVLDATGKVTWSWWWVVSPLLAALALRGMRVFIQAALNAKAKNDSPKDTKIEKAWP